jgi:outer membrane protein OmpA-like peptidoglycan-associated protein
MHSAARAFLVVFIATVAGCASQGSVVLLPEKDGHPTSLTVTQGERSVVLDQPYAAAQQTPFGPYAYQSSAAEVDAKFGAALAAQAPRAAVYTLYFVEGKDEFTDESKATVDGIFAEIAKRPVPDIVVVGHTDRTGSDPANDALALQRAETVRAELVRRGIAADAVVAVGRGSREPLVPTAAGVAEPRNRRVEIVVR